MDGVHVINRTKAASERATR